jgi:hypothetical protein
MEAGSSNLAAAPAALAARAPAPTAAPLRRHASDVPRVRVRADEFAERAALLAEQQQQAGSAAPQEVVVGPFYGGLAEAQRVRRQLESEPGAARRLAAEARQAGSERSLPDSESPLRPRARAVRAQQLADEDLLGKRLVPDAEWTKRQTAEEQRCFVGNDQLSCFPTADTRVTQGTWSRVSTAT